MLCSDMPLQISALVEHLLDEQKQKLYLKRTIFGLFIFTVLLLAAMTGLTYAVVKSLKDTKVRESSLCHVTL